MQPHKTRRPNARRRRKQPRAPRPCEVWPRRSLAKYDAAFAAAARRMQTRETPARQSKHLLDPLVVALQASRAVRLAVGQVDASGQGDAAASAVVTRGKQWTEAQIALSYKHGRAGLMDLAKAVEDEARALGFQRSGTAPIASFQNAHWRMTIRLTAGRQSARTRHGPIMRR